MSWEPCLCGDLYCYSCGPAQGNTRCYFCGAWELDGGCRDPDQCEEAERKQWERYERSGRDEW